MQVKQAFGILFVFLSASMKSSARINESARSGQDDSDRCLWQLDDDGKRVSRFSSLPGGGWDNLRNLDMGLVASLSFTNCKLSDDGLYVLPQSVILYARKESTLEVRSEIMDHYNNYTSSVSHSINLGSYGILKVLGIGGKFSEEYLNARSISVQSGLQVGRTRLMYRRYSAKMQPDFQLSESLTNRLKEIVNALTQKRTKLVRYLSDLIVRDFGTHVVTSVEAGGTMEKVVFFQSDSISNGSLTRNKFSAAMSASFHVLLGVEIGGDEAVSKEDIDRYSKSVSTIIIKSFGGQNLGPKPKLDKWLQTLNDNLVPIDRNGEPLCDVISERALPDVKPLQLIDLRTEIESAIERYYQANTIIGCTDPGSSNFDPLANVPGECAHLATNYSFAGVFQMCHDNNPDAKFNLCAQDSQSGATKNPLTGGFNCPVEYDAIPLLSTIGRKARRCQKKTKPCWLLFHCDDGEECVESMSTLEAFWCAAGQGEQLSTQSGTVYGGAFAADGRFVNEITQTTACSAHFRPYLIGRDIFLCLSFDLDTAAKHRIPLGGFFSCKNGNPLAEPKRPPPVALKAVLELETDNEELPKRCPEGFSQSTLDIVDGCSVMQCVKAQLNPGKFPVRLPPFEDPDYELLEESVKASNDGEAAKIAWGVVGGVLGAVGVGGTAAYLVKRKRSTRSAEDRENCSGEGHDVPAGVPAHGSNENTSYCQRDTITQRFQNRLSRCLAGRSPERPNRDTEACPASSSSDQDDDCRRRLLEIDAPNESGGSSGSRRGYASLEDNTGSAEGPQQLVGSENATTLKVREMMRAIRPRDLS